LYLGFYDTIFVSIYLEDELRGRGIGKKLIEEHTNWFKEKECSCIRLAVSYGHEDSVRDFYHRMGFFERLTYFELKVED